MPVISEQVVMLRGIQWGKEGYGTLSIMSFRASVHLEQFSCLQWGFVSTEVIKMQPWGFYSTIFALLLCCYGAKK